MRFCARRSSPENCENFHSLSRSSFGYEKEIQEFSLIVGINRVLKIIFLGTTIALTKDKS